MPPIEAWKPKGRCFVPTLETNAGGCMRQECVTVGSGVATKKPCAQ
jgi:hypothetical protein